MQTLAQNFGIAMYMTPVTRSNDSSIDAASAQAAWVSMKGYSKVTFILQCGAMTEADLVVSAHEAKAVAGTSASTSALALTHYWSNKASVSTAILTRTSTNSSSQVVVDATNNATYVFEIDAKQLNATSSFDCVGLVFQAISAATLFGVTAILHPARYASDPMVVNVNAN